jgi:hypothetical protein
MKKQGNVSSPKPHHNSSTTEPKDNELDEFEREFKSLLLKMISNH